MSARWVLLPGMDGIGRFRALRQAVGDAVDCRALSYPPDIPLDYAALTDRVRQALRTESDYLLVAESFSGPIAIRLAAERPPRLRALVLAASFCASPITGWKRALLRRSKGLLFSLRPPRFVADFFLLGGGSPQEVADDLYASLQQVSARVFALRLREILDVDDCGLLPEIDVPVLYLRATRDHLVGDRAVRRIARWCGHFELHPIDAPHMVLQRQPEQAVAAIRRFLAQHKIS